MTARAGPGPFDFPAAHVIELSVQPEDIDGYGHVNNAVYLNWLDRVAWSHSASLGVPLERCLALRRGMAAQRIEIEYLRAAVRGDRIRAATWIVSADGRLRAERRFQIVRVPDGTTLARARVDYVCINLDSGRAARMPEMFARAYVVTAASN
ncbi:MAG TPA: acyl-CoA thioesterase [Steroidobacteraceae bacterium]|jgi:acyl-CoA thioester hydrolase|nr:acyl-CoA thioesterase [Steroidobacteraceae bacterium]